MHGQVLDSEPIAIPLSSSSARWVVFWLLSWEKVKLAPAEAQEPPQARRLLWWNRYESKLLRNRLEYFGCGRRDRRTGGSGFWLADVDATLEVGAVFDADAGGSHVAAQRALGADVHAVGGSYVATHFAQDDDFACDYVSRDLSVAANGDAVAGKVDAALDFSVDKKRL